MPISLARISKTMLTESGKSKYHLFCPDHRRKGFDISSFIVALSVDYFIDAPIRLRTFLSISSLKKVLFLNHE